MRGLTIHTICMHVLAALVGALFLSYVDAYDTSKLFPDDLTKATVWAALMLLGWTKMLIGCFVFSYFLNHSQTAGLVLVIGTAFVVAIPMTFEVRAVITAMGPAIPMQDSLATTYLRSVVMCGAFGLIGWCAIQRMPMGRPPVGWREMLRHMDRMQQSDTNAHLTALPAGTGSGPETALASASAGALSGLPAPSLMPLPIPAPTPHPSLPNPETIGEPGTASAVVPPDPSDLSVGSVLRDSGDRKESHKHEGPIIRLARMPENLDGSIQTIEAEDHYLKINTDCGSGMILGRLGDAASELGETTGRRVHRSWWVADAAISGWSREGRNISLRLIDGRIIPISRSYATTLRNTGWLSNLPQIG